MIDRYIRTKYRLLVILIVTVLVSTVAMVQNAYATEVEASGTCGESLTWELDSAGTLTISGTGDMYYYNPSEAPWYEYWTDIESIVISEGVTSISGNAFNPCSIAESITIPKSLIGIGCNAFKGCAFKKVYISDLKKYLSIPMGSHWDDNNPTANGADLYLDGSIVEDLVIPDGITSIPYGCLEGCTSIKSVTIPEGVTTIYSYAFVSCNNLTEISFPKSLSAINACAFSGCNNIEKLYISDLSSYLRITYETGGNVDPLTAYGADLYINNVKVDKLVIPGDVTHIGYDVLKGCSVEEIEISDGVKSIGTEAFMNCKNLRSVSISDSVRSIGQNAFAGCSNLTTIYIPNGVVSMESGAFGNVKGTFYIKKDSYAEQYLTERGYTIEYYCFGDHTWEAEPTVDKAATCTEDGSQSIHCSVCEAKDETTVEVIPKTEHKYGDWTTTKEATCTEDGSKEKVCEVCEDKVTEVIPATGHLFSDEFTTDTEPTCTAEGSKSKHCTKCNAIDESSVTVMSALGHNWDSGKITTEPTCTDEGVKTFACNRCEETKTEVVPATGHSFSGEFTTDTEPTCTAEGSKSKHCTKCDAVTEVTVIPANGHTFGPWEVVTPSTCEGAGSHQHSCEVCGFTEAEATDPTGHDIEENYTIDVPATCTEDGSQSKHCKNCEVTFDSQVIPATGHNYGEWKTTLEPTCTAKGSKEHVCSTCDDKVIEDIPALDHAWNEEPTVDKAATCTETGSQSIHCARCNEVMDAETIPALGHDWSATPIVDKKATCTEDGKESTHCTRCDAVQEESEKAIPATGHKFSSWATTKKATEIAAGQQTRKCSVCGKTETKTIAQLKPTLPAVKITTPKAAKKSAAIKWKKVSKANQKKIASIQVQYSLDKSFKTGVKTVTAKKTAASKKITKLTSKKTYYVRIRAYKKSGSVVHVSKWSTVKKVKAK